MHRCISVYVRRVPFEYHSDRLHLHTLTRTSVTFMLVFALVRKKGMPYRAARSLPSASVTWIFDVISALLPMSTLLTPASACWEGRGGGSNAKDGNYMLRVHPIVRSFLGYSNTQDSCRARTPLCWQLQVRRVPTQGAK